MKSLFFIVLLLAAPLAADVLFEQPPTLEWTPVSEAYTLDSTGTVIDTVAITIDHFRLYYGEESFNRNGAWLAPWEAHAAGYPYFVIKGDQTEFTPSSLRTGTYYFRISAVMKTPGGTQIESTFNENEAGEPEEVQATVSPSLQIELRLWQKTQETATDYADPAETSP